MPQRSFERGVLYVAVGEPFVRAACASAASVRRVHPELATGLFADAEAFAQPRVASAFDFAQPVASPHRRSKVDFLAATPFERTLYLDADTRVIAPIADVFDLLDTFDLAMAHAHARNRALTNQTWRCALPASFPQFNGGVIAYRNSAAVKSFLDEWRAAFHASGFRKDQVTLRELAWLSQLRIATLAPEYNVRRPSYLLFWRRKEAAPRILHLKSFSRDSLVRRALERLLGALAAKPWQP